MKGSVCLLGFRTAIVLPFSPNDFFPDATLPERSVRVGPLRGISEFWKVPGELLRGNRYAFLHTGVSY